MSGLCRYINLKADKNQWLSLLAYLYTRVKNGVESSREKQTGGSYGLASRVRQSRSPTPSQPQGARPCRAGGARSMVDARRRPEGPLASSGPLGRWLCRPTTSSASTATKAQGERLFLSSYLSSSLTAYPSYT